MKQEENPHPHELISAFSDQVTSPQETERLQEHLRGCAECRQWLHDLNALATAVGEESVPALPPQLAERIRQRIGSGSPARPAPGTTSFWRSPFPLAAAATLLMATTLWMAWRREVPMPSTPGVQALQAPARSQDAKTRPAAEAQSAPAPVSRPTAAKNDAEKTEHPAQALRSLGYAGSAADPSTKSRVEGNVAADSNAPSAASPPAVLMAPPPTAPANGRSDKAPAPQNGAPRQNYLDLITSSGLTGEEYKKAKERQAPAEAGPEKDSSSSEMGYASEPPAQRLKESTPGDSVEGARSLAYEGPDFSATFSEDGLVTVIARGYACSVTVPAPPAPVGGGQKRTVEDLSGLFAAASSHDFLATGSSREGPQAAPGASASRATSSLALRNGEGDAIHSAPFSEPLPQDSPQILRTLRQGIQVLIQQRYRKNLETRCGPLPEALTAEH